jgi:hypothetical protein
MFNIVLLNLLTKKRPIKIFLQGGVGNQLFQYFFARYVVTKLKMQSILNTSLIDSTNLSHPNSNILSLNLQIPIDKSTTTRKLFYKFLLNYFPKINSRLKLKISSLKVSTASEIGYDKDIDDVILNHNSKYLLGYYQSWKYFQLCSFEKNTIFNGFTYKDPWVLSNYKIMSSIKFTAVHIRLGDYRLNKNNFIGVLPPDYYSNCINHLAGLNYSQKFYIFSDQINAAKNLYGNIFPKDSIWVNSSSDCNPLEILSIMSLANVFIIANSTFSWWAANLAADDSLVLAPNKWFKNASDPIDLLPPKWNLIETGWSSFEK